MRRDEGLRDIFHAVWLNATNPYRLLFGDRKDGFIWVSKRGRFWAITHDGYSVLSPSPRCMGVRTRVFERRFEPVFKVESGETVMDVGASYGDTSVLFARKCAPGLLIAVEPEPLNAEALERNLAGYNHLVVRRVAWNKRDRLRFHVNPSVCGHSIDGLADDVGSMEVEADTIDSIAGGRGIDFLKVDVQGAELMALEGAAEVLKTVRKVVVETHYVNGLSTAFAVYSFLSRLGFCVKTTPQVEGCDAPDVIHAFRKGSG